MHRLGHDEILASATVLGNRLDVRPPCTSSGDPTRVVACRRNRFLASFSAMLISHVLNFDSPAKGLDERFLCDVLSIRLIFIQERETSRRHSVHKAESAGGRAEYLRPKIAEIISDSFPLWALEYIALILSPPFS